MKGSRWDATTLTCYATSHCVKLKEAEIVLDFYSVSSVGLFAHRKSLYHPSLRLILTEKHNYNDALNYFEVNPKPFTIYEVSSF